jgi:predicted phage terminase large subunit-like protein
MKEDLHILFSTNKKKAVTAYLLKQNFRSYLAVMFYYTNESEFIFKPFHDTIIQKLQDIADCKNDKRNLCINVPVGSGKSIIVEYFITWCFARSINHTFCYASNSDSLITRLSKESKGIVESVLWQQLFGTPLSLQDQSVYSWSFKGSNNRTGLTAGSMGGALTGLDAGNPNKEGFPGALIIDDPIDADKVRYVSYRNAAIESYDNKLATRRRSPRTPTILIMQRLHLLDLAGWAKSTDGENWDFVTIPALDSGVSFWPEKYPVIEMEQISRTNPSKFAAQYQQKPIVAGGEVIKTEWFKYYTSYQDIHFRKIIITADTAQKKKEHNDYSVFMACGVLENGLYVLDIIRGKWEAPELKTNADAFWHKWSRGLNGVHCSAFYVEDKSSGTGLIQQIQRESAIPVIAVPRTKDKLTRVEDNLPYIESGRVFLPVSPEYGFNPVFLSECESFARDMSHPHDDQIDTLCDAIEKGIAKGKVSILDVI